jgi:dTDP-4-amino-4,6-dideoxygalactose transaminase
MINVTKTFFPPIEEYQNQLKRIWDNQWLTNRGSLVVELEDRIRNYLELQDSNLIIMNNGTIPLQIALKLLGNCGEIITTPFSYVATASAIVWEHCNPVFVDIHPDYLTINEVKIEEAITDKTTCILATHVFGNPCNIEIIESIAKKYNLFVIYDAAHCFGVKYKNKSIFEYGDVSTCSFHATKIFHTGEGGALFVTNEELYHKCYYSHNFGHNGPLDFFGLGINGKISELQAAMGLSVLPFMTNILAHRAKIIDTYQSAFKSSSIQLLKIRENTEWNYSYFPVVFNTEEKLLKVQTTLNDKQIFPRRYFYPALNTVSYVNGPTMRIAESISKRILCLPLSHQLENDVQLKIIDACLKEY